MTKFFTIITILVFSGLCSCTDNMKAKTFGGTITVDLPKGSKLVNATWKDQELWYLTRPMREGESSEVHTFQEKSSFGFIEGTVIFKEKE